MSEARKVSPSPSPITRGEATLTATIFPGSSWQTTARAYAPRSSGTTRRTAATTSPS